MTEQEIGAAISRDIWKYLQEMKCVELVPWNKNPLDLAKQEGTKKAYEDLERFIKEKAQEYKSR